MIKINNEFKVGIFVVLCIVGFFYLLLSTGKLHIKSGGYNLYVIFDEVSGIEKNAPVLFNGLEVGRVTDINISNKDDETKLILQLLIDEGVKIRSMPQISIKTLGLMGEKYIQISSYKGKDFIKPNTYITGKKPADMDVVMEQAESISKNVDSLILELKKLTINLNDTMETNKESINNIFANIDDITTDIRFTFQDNRTSIDNIIKRMEIMTLNLEDFSEDIKDHPWKLLFRSKEENRRTREKLKKMEESRTSETEESTKAERTNISF